LRKQLEERGRLYYALEAKCKAVVGESEESRKDGESRKDEEALESKITLTQEAIRLTEKSGEHKS
jgi:hypothetical protein